MVQGKLFEKFLEYKFEELTCFPFGSRSPLAKILPFDLLRAELFYPTSAANIQSTDMTCKIAGEIAEAMASDMQDKRKATSLYILDGVKSMKNVTEEERQANMGREASNSRSEAAHAHSTSNIKDFPMMRLDSCAAMGQSKMNNDLGRDHRKVIARGRKKTVNKKGDSGKGLLFSYPFKAQQSLITMARCESAQSRCDFDDDLERQQKKSQEKVQFALEKKIEDTGEEFINNLYLFDMYK